MAANELAQKRDQDSIPLIRQALSSASGALEKVNLAIALMTLGDPGGIAALHTVCLDQNVREDLRLNVAERLDDSGDEGCLSAIVDILASTDDLSMRSGALDYLERNQKIPSDLIQTLQVGLERALRDQIPTTRQSASDAIAMFAPPAGWTLLTKAIAVEKNDATRLKMQQDLAQLKGRNSNTPRIHNRNAQTR